MPNWSEYGVAITGPTEAIAALDKAITVPEPQQSSKSDGTHDFTLVRPIPEALNITAGWISKDSPEYVEWRNQQIANLEEYGYKDWYDWCVVNWGTKWPPSVHNYSLTDSPGGKSEIHANGESAWGPPSELMAWITAEYPVKIVMTYKEDGMGFAGAQAFQGGLPIYEDTFRYVDVPQLADLEKKMADLDVSDDEWHETYEDYQDEIHTQIEERECEACRKVDILEAMR